MPRHGFAVSALAIVAACSAPSDVAQRTGVEEKSASATASAASAQGRKVEEDNDTYSYALSYPQQVAAIPELAAKIEADAKRAKDEMVAEAQAGRKDAKANDYPFNPHSLSEEWQVVADLPGYLSLSNTFATYTGGAHGMYGLSGLVWDKAKKRAFASEDLFQAPSYLGGTIGDALCAALNKERVNKGMDPVEEGTDQVFPPCPGLDEATILVGSSNGKTFDRITVWYGPYVAGSYAEGAYELDFPMTAAMLEAVKPAYRSAFSAKK